jgi:hypothetical protein
MIAIANASGDFLRAIPENTEKIFGYHRLFGFISEQACAERLSNRRSHGLKVSRAEWLFRFRLQPLAGAWKLVAIEGCSATPASNGTWELHSKVGNFLVSPSAALAATGAELTSDEGNLNRLLAASITLFLLFAGFLWWTGSSNQVETVVPIPEPVTVKILPPSNAVRIPAPALTTPHPEIASKAKDDGGKRAVAQNLGFLGMLGKKELTKAVGGIPSGLQNVSPGAGLEGDKGSGGEMLVGLGQGVKRTTVGNTGLAGLGGVGGGKGPGGGAGGYGDTLVGSGTGAGVGQGNGRSLSTLPLSNDIELEGGLDKAVISATIAKYLSQVRACYEIGLRKNPALSGQVNMGFEIGPSGKLNFARVAKSTLGDAEVPECIATKMLTWDFPKPVGGVNVKVNYPFLLRPVNS